MTISTKRCGKSIAVDLEGPLAARSEASPLQPLIESFVVDPDDRVIVNLERVSRLDCTGIGDLIVLRTLVQRQGGSLILINVPARPQRMLEMAGLLPVLTESDVLSS